MATGFAVRGFSWTHSGRAQPALDGVSLRIEPGERVLICGDSGSGKSTLLAGLVGVLGGEEEGHAQGSIDRVGSGEVGMVLQDPDSQVIAARVGDDVAFGCENLGVPREEIWRRVRAALELVGLDVGLDHPTARLSGGQKQRLALAGVLAMRPGAIVLDEPTANLDPEGAADVVRSVDRIAQETGATLIVVEHNYQRWQGVLERGVLIERGRVAADAGFAEVTAARALPPLPPARPVTAGDPVVRCEDLVCRFGPRRSLDIPRGASTVVTGPNGVGKSTWAQTVAGLLSPVAGKVTLAADGQTFSHPHRWRSAKLAQRIGFVFQDPDHQFVARTVAEELRVGPKVMGTQVSEDELRGLARRLRLEYLWEANPFSLSGGEKRRLSVATALVAAPEVVILDEPTFGQDPTTFVELVSILRGLCDAGTAVVSITHDPDFIETMGDYRLHFAAEGVR